jgi:hypothetical protein
MHIDSIVKMSEMLCNGLCMVYTGKEACCQNDFQIITKTHTQIIFNTYRPIIKHSECVELLLCLDFSSFLNYTVPVSQLTTKHTRQARVERNSSPRVSSLQRWDSCLNCYGKKSGLNDPTLQLHLRDGIRVGILQIGRPPVHELLHPSVIMLSTTNRNFVGHCSLSEVYLNRHWLCNVSIAVFR